MKTERQAVVLAVILAAATRCYGRRPKLSLDLESRDPQALVNVIVQDHQMPQQRHIDAVLRIGGRHLRTLKVVNLGYQCSRQRDQCPR